MAGIGQKFRTFIAARAAGQYNLDMQLQSSFSVRANSYIPSMQQQTTSEHASKEKAFQQWSIGLFMGSSPFELGPMPQITNPIITFADVSDVPADFVADPFMVQHGDIWYLFFELLNNATGLGAIGVSSSHDWQHWHYKGLVLEGQHHLSYPHIVVSEGRHFMIPESYSAPGIMLYEAQQFPFDWQPVATLVEGSFADATVFEHNNSWWMFASPDPFGFKTLNLYHADALTGPWHPHPMNPVVENDIHRARPAGKVISWNGQLLRFAQDCRPRYGSQVRAMQITHLSQQHYEEKEHLQSPILTGSGKGWNAQRMHHTDLHQLPNGQWLACVDGHAAPPADER